jgi:hypothetical protein
MEAGGHLEVAPLRLPTSKPRPCSSPARETGAGRPRVEA